MLPLVNKISTLADNQDPEPAHSKEQSKQKPHLDEAGWLPMGCMSIPWMPSNSKSGLHGIMAAFESITIFESAGLNIWLANANM